MPSRVQRVLVSPVEEGALPTLAFDRLITELALLAPRFRLQLPLASVS